jgi:hypothetical protein
MRYDATYQDAPQMLHSSCIRQEVSKEWHANMMS